MYKKNVKSKNNEIDIVINIYTSVENVYLYDMTTAEYII